MNIQWQTNGPADGRQEHYAYVDGKLAGRVMPFYRPQGDYVYAAEVHTPKVVFVGDYHTPDEAKQALEDAVKEQL